MKLTRKILRSLIKEEYKLLIEQEDLLGGGDEEAEDTEEATDEDAEETPAEDEGEEAAEEDEEKEEEVEPAIDETDPLAKSVDDELNAIFVDFEAEAISDAGAEIASVETQSENKKYSLIRILYEQEEIPSIDMETFAANVARLVKNYDSLLDMKAIIVKKAQDYIANKYDVELGDALLDILNLRYDISLDIPEAMTAPMAVGASTTAAEGGI